MINFEKKKSLWLRIKKYHFEDVVPTQLWDKVQEAFGGKNATEHAFAAKVSRKLGWKREFTHRAIAEYKKFIYLAMISKVQVTPSKIIDAVWHEHVMFTRGYRKFCEEILGRYLDHEPSLLETDKQIGIFDAQYADTIELYEDEFNVDVPEDIWGITKFKKEKVKKDRVYWPEPNRGGVGDMAEEFVGDGLDMQRLYEMFDSVERADVKAYPELHFNDGNGPLQIPGHGHTGGIHSYGNDGDTFHSTISHDTTDVSTGGDDSGSSCSSASSCGGGCGGGGD